MSDNMRSTPLGRASVPPKKEAVRVRPDRSQQSSLHVDWATHEAAEFACKHYHYSKCIPRSKLVKIGAWENGKFIGVIIFSYGATQNIGKPYNLPQSQICELTRVALSRHDAPVSQIMSRAIKMLKRENPGLRLVVSYADPGQGHHGGIYQASGWTYEGGAPTYTMEVNGERVHPRTLSDRYGTSSVEKLAAMGVRAVRVDLPPKHKYVLPLDKKMRKELAPRSKPYPPASSE